jgi:hypothetical protein
MSEENLLSAYLQPEARPLDMVRLRGRWSEDEAWRGQSPEDRASGWSRLTHHRILQARQRGIRETLVWRLVLRNPSWSERRTKMGLGVSPRTGPGSP